VTHERASVEWLPAALRRGVPWKNGGGITREVVASPAGAGLDRFDWRISTAEVRTAGPFSAFAGIERTLCILEGSLSLAIAGRTAIVLSADSAPFEFAGDDPAHGAPLDGPVMDLNVMARRGSFNARVQRLQAGVAVKIGTDTTVLFALGVLTVAAGGRAWVLTRGDALRFFGPGDCRLESAENAAAYRIEISPATALR
jgi:environmental stress-induced protein Ves